jgi:hypothetical protein
MSRIKHGAYGVSGAGAQVLIDGGVIRRTGGQWGEYGGHATPDHPLPVPTPAAVLVRGAVMAVIALHHSPVTSVAPNGGQFQPMVGLSCPLTVSVAIDVTES